MRVKLIRALSHDDLEARINDYLDKNALDVVDIKFQSDEKNYYYDAMILYETIYKTKRDKPVVKVKRKGGEKSCES